MTYWFCYQNCRLATLSNESNVTWWLAMLGTDLGYYWKGFEIIWHHYRSTTRFSDIHIIFVVKSYIGVLM